MDSAGNMTVQFDPVEGMQRFSIVDTDYEEYAILYSCLNSRSTGFTGTEKTVEWEMRRIF